MCRLRNIAMRDYQKPKKCDYQKSVTTGQTDGQTDAGQSDPYVPLCFTGDTTNNLKTDLNHLYLGSNDLDLWINHLNLGSNTTYQQMI